MNRKTFLKAIGLAGVGTLLYSWQLEPFWLEFVYQKMPIKNLPRALEGKIMMQISDLHIGNRFDWKFIIDSFQEAKNLQPDIVVYTGDFVTWEDEEQLGQLDRVMEHAVRGSLGTFGVLGNHDYGNRWREISVADSIVKVLNNHGINIIRDAVENVEGLNIYGFEELWSPNFNPSRVMKDWNENEANIVLCHNPEVCDLPIWNGYNSWILSGHTHGGQCKIPFLSPPIIPVTNRKYTAGKLDLEDGRTLYINRALGHSYQIRFNVRPEITVFQLVSTS